MNFLEDKVTETVISLDGLREFIRRNEIETVAIAGADFHGMARGKKVPAWRILESDSSPMRMSNLLAMLDMSGMPFPPPDDDDRWWPSWAEGYQDTRAVLDPATVRLVPWQPATCLVLCDFEHVNCKGAVDYYPRETLKRLLARLKGHGFDTLCSTEPEFTLLRESADTVREKNYSNLVPLWPDMSAYSLTTLGKYDGIVDTLRAHLTGLGIPIETWGVEAGPGQIELNIAPVDALRAADDGFLFKHAVKEIAAANDLMATFIPKTAVMGFGNGSHLNFSLWKDGSNAFHSGDFGAPHSTTLKRFASGIASTLREMTLLYAPTVNSYRRFIPYFSAGMTASWGHDNKSVTVRSVTEAPKLTRLEVRTAGADVNPYLQVAAVVAAGLYGLENGVEVAPTLGDAYGDASLAHVPTSIGEAIELFEQSEVANKYLGEDFVRFYALSRRREAEAFAAATAEDVDTSEVTAWEIARYLETA